MFFLLISFLQSPFTKEVNANAYVNACTETCINQTGDPDEECSYLCSEGNQTYGCLIASQIGWFDEAYDENSQDWCKYVQNPTQLCSNRCEIVNYGYPGYPVTCSDVCGDSFEDSLECESLAPDYFEDPEVDTSFCSMLDVESPLMDIHFNEDPFEMTVGLEAYIEGEIYSDKEVVEVILLDNYSNEFLASCSIEVIEGYDYSFSCLVPSSDYNNPGEYYYKIGVTDIDDFTYVSHSAYLVITSTGIQILTSSLPEKTFNESLTIKGKVFSFDDSNITEINILSDYEDDSPQTVLPCTCDDDVCDEQTESFTCELSQLETESWNQFCIEAFDEYDTGAEVCPGIVHDSEIEENLMAHWPLDNFLPTREMIGYAPSALVANPSGFISVEGYTNQGRSFLNNNYLYISDYNKHYSFSEDNSSFYTQAYVKIDENPPNYPILLGKMDMDRNQYDDPEITWAMGLSNSSGIFCSVYSIDSENEPQTIMHRIDTSEWGEESTYLTLGEWNKIGCSWDAATRELAAYLDNQKVASQILDEGIVIKESSGPVVIGAKNTGWDPSSDESISGSGWDDFTGQLDEIKIFNEVVLEEEEEPLTGYFTNVNAPTVVKNSSTFNLTGTAQYTSEISSIEYRLYEEGLDTNDNWQECSCTDEYCDSSNEEFSCNLTGLTNDTTYTYQIKFSHSEGSEYLSDQDWHTVDVFRYDANDLVAWWPFGNTSTLYDYSGNSRNGTITGGNDTSISSLTGSKTNIFDQDTHIEISDPEGDLTFNGIDDEFRVEVKLKTYNAIENDGYDLIWKEKNEGGTVWNMFVYNDIAYGSVHSRYDYRPAGEEGEDKSSILVNEWNTIKYSYSNQDLSTFIKVNNNRPVVEAYHINYDLGDSEQPLRISAQGKLEGEVDDIKIFSTSDAKAPQVEFEDIGNLERVTSSNMDIDITVTDETGVDTVEYLFFQSDGGDDLDSEDWIQVSQPSTGNWGDKNLVVNIQRNDLEDGPWNLFVRATDSNGFKHFYENGWYTHVSIPSPSAMPYLHFVVEAQDTTPPYIFAHSIVPNPTVDRSPGVRGFVKDYIDPDTGDTASNIHTVEYQLNEEEWTEVPPLDGDYDSPMEEFFFKFEDLEPGDYTLRIRAVDVEGNSTDGNGTTHEETFTIYEPEETPETSVIEKVEEFTNHDLHDVLFSDGVWGNGILRLRQEIEFGQETEYFTSHNDFGWTYGDSRTSTFDAYDGNVWFITHDNRLNYYNTQTGESTKYPAMDHPLTTIQDVKDFVYQGRRYLLVKHHWSSPTVVYDINNTPSDTSDDPEFVSYANKEGFNSYQMFSFVGFDTRNGKFAYFANVGNDAAEEEKYFFIWLDTKGTIMDLDDDTYVTWGRDDNLFYIDEENGYVQENEFTAAYFDQEENIFYAASYAQSVFQCTDGGTPENKADDSCQRYEYPNDTNQVFSILKDPNDYYWFGGDNGLTRIHRKGTLSIADDEVVRVLTRESIGHQDISQIKWIPGQYPVGDEIWILTRSGYIKALEFNFTYNDTLDDTMYSFKIGNVYNRQGGFSNFTMPNRNTIFTSIQGYGLQRISLTREFADTNTIEMLPRPPDGILAINYIDLEEVLGTVTQNGQHTFNELVSYEVSNDAGVTWYPISLAERVTFPTPDYKLKLRINLNRGSSPIVELIKLTYITYPDQEGDQCDIKINSKSPAITSIINSGTNSMTVNFLKILSEPNIQNYVLEYGLANNLFNFPSINISPFVSSYTIPNLSVNTEYFFRLKAVTNCTQSSWSEVLSAQITPEQPVQPPVIKPKPQPSTPPAIPGEEPTTNTC